MAVQESVTYWTMQAAWVNVSTWRLNKKSKQKVWDQISWQFITQNPQSFELKLRKPKIAQYARNALHL